ncbi:MAG: cobyric acid synthase CobQ, partial [Dehalococcoidia bacterium]
VFDHVERGGTTTGDGDGAVSPSGNVVGTYLHGLFASDGLRRALLHVLARRRGADVDTAWGAPVPDPYDRLAGLVAPSLDLRAIGALAGLDVTAQAARA